MKFLHANRRMKPVNGGQDELVNTATTDGSSHARIEA